MNNFPIPTFTGIPPEPVCMPLVFSQPAEFPGEVGCSITVCKGLESGIIYVLDVKYGEQHD